MELMAENWTHKLKLKHRGMLKTDLFPIDYAVFLIQEVQGVTIPSHLSHSTSVINQENVPRAFHQRCKKLDFAWRKF